MYRHPQYSLSVFTKLPVLGQVKTRMQPDYSREFSLSLHEHLIDYALKQWLEACQCPVHLWLAGDAHAAGDCVESGSFRSSVLPVSLQQGGDLGERLYRAATAQLEEFEGVLLVGTDCPFIDSNYLQAACESLSYHDVVIGPAGDGGYVLLGIKRALPQLFNNIEWGTERVLAGTMEKITSLHLDCYLLPVLHDIDRPGDLQLLSKIGYFNPLLNWQPAGIINPATI